MIWIAPSEKYHRRAARECESFPQNHMAGLLRCERQLLANPSAGVRKDDDLRWQFGDPFDANLFS